MFSKILIFATFTFLSVQNTPLDTKPIGQEDINQLLNRAKILLTSIETKIGDQEKVLEAYITSIVETAQLTKENGIKELDDDVYELVRLVEVVKEDAEEQGNDVSNCIGNTVVNLQTEAKTVETNFIQSIEQNADKGVEEFGNNIVESYSELEKVETSLVQAQICKLKEDVEQAACTAELSVRVSRLELEVPTAIDYIISSSNEHYLNILELLENERTSTITNFYYQQLSIVNEVIVCAGFEIGSTTENSDFQIFMDEQPQLIQE